MSVASCLPCQLDHLVVCASSLDAGVNWFRALSSLELPAGGSHPLMATHNHLSALSDTAFFEIIAIDPSAAAVQRRRWFNLDDQTFRQDLQSAPRLTTWVLRTPDLQGALSALKREGIDAGEPVLQTRGTLQWHIGLRADGTLACDGVFPILIQWPPEVNPVNRMQDQGLRLNALSLEHPEADRVLAGLQVLGADHLANLRTGKASLNAQLSVGSHQFQLHYRPSQ